MLSAGPALREGRGGGRGSMVPHLHMSGPCLHPCGVVDDKHGNFAFTNITCTSKGHRKGSQTLGFSQKRSAKGQERVSFPFSHQQSSGFNLPFTRGRQGPRIWEAWASLPQFGGETPAGYPRNVQKEVTEDQWPRGGQCVRDLGDGNNSPGGRGKGGRCLWFALS